MLANYVLRYLNAYFNVVYYFVCVLCVYILKLLSYLIVVIFFRYCICLRDPRCFPPWDSTKVSNNHTVLHLYIQEQLYIQESYWSNTFNSNFIDTIILFVLALAHSTIFDGKHLVMWLGVTNWPLQGVLRRLLGSPNLICYARSFFWICKFHGHRDLRFSLVILTSAVFFLGGCNWFTSVFAARKSHIRYNLCRDFLQSNLFLFFRSARNVFKNQQALQKRL